MSKFVQNGPQLSGDIRPVLPPEHISEVQQDMVDEMLSLGNVIRPSVTATMESSVTMPPAKVNNPVAANNSALVSTQPASHTDSSGSKIVHPLAISLPTVTTVATPHATNTSRLRLRSLKHLSTILKDGAFMNNSNPPAIKHPANPETPISLANPANTLRSTSPARLLPGPTCTSATTKPNAASHKNQPSRGSPQPFGTGL